MSQLRTSSIQRFKQMSLELQKEVKAASIEELNESADELVQQMKQAAPLGPTGRLRASIRKAPGKKPTRIRILAGGPLTTVAARAGHGQFDYSLWVEFGTSKTAARPFFWPSWRLRRKKIRSRLKRKITANIKKRSAA